ncbi:Na+/H+ antiporter subunit G [Ramlibacter sp.]|uniref:Na+/H+ antiporter subunit G n=1 Tax=Ramlibacter sp. TaxID=1917967 RepID=UPI002FC6AD73
MGMIELHPLLQALVAFLLVVGGSFCLIGAIGLVRFRDFYMRLHAPTKASTLGVGGLLLASMALHWLQGEWVLRELLITLFLFVTAPVSANLLAQAALHLRVRSVAEPPQDLDRRQARFPADTARSN